MDRFVLVLKIGTTILNLMFGLAIFYFARGLSWGNKEDRFSIAGFSIMLALYFSDSALLWV